MIDNSDLSLPHHCVCDFVLPFIAAIRRYANRVVDDSRPRRSLVSRTLYTTDNMTKSRVLSTVYSSSKQNDYASTEKSTNFWQR